jgi:hypothetical protein
MSFHHSPRIVSNGLVLYLDAANPKSYTGSGTTWSDLSGNGNNGTLTNGPTFDSSNNGGIKFDGVNDWVVVSDNPTINFTSQLTISLWFFSGTNITGVNDYDLLYLKGFTNDSPVDSMNPQIGIDGGYGWRGPIQSPTTFRSFYVPPAGFLQTNTWYNLTYTHVSGNTPIVYKNGTSQSGFTYLSGTGRSTDGTLPLSTNTRPLTICGDSPRNAGSRFTGRMSIVSVYNRALTESEVLQNFNALRGRFGL